MAKNAVCKETCLSCIHAKFCLVHWGTECKRQGGKRIPRMRSIKVKGKQNASKSVKDVPAKKKPVNKKLEKPRQIIFNLFEPIITRVANWR